MSELDDKVAHLRQDMSLYRRQLETKRGDDEVCGCFLRAIFSAVYLESVNLIDPSRVGYSLTDTSSTPSRHETHHWLLKQCMMEHKNASSPKNNSIEVLFNAGSIGIVVNWPQNMFRIK